MVDESLTSESWMGDESLTSEWLNLEAVCIRVHTLLFP